MRLDTVTAEIRPRSDWEAVDLGFAMVRRGFWRCITVWWLAMLLPTAVAAVLLWDYPILFLFLFWWWKPAGSRMVLFEVSRRLFGENPTWKAVFKELSGAWGRRFFYRFFVARFSPWLPVMLAVEDLEKHRGKAYKQRGAQVARRGESAVMWLFMVADFAAGWMGMALLMGLRMLIPEGQDGAWQQAVDSWDSNYPMELPLLITRTVVACVMVAMSLVDCFVTGAGFGIYINNRTWIEGWDVELAFRRLARRLGAVSLILVAFFVSSSPVRADEQRAPAEIIREVKADPDFKVHTVTEKVRKDKGTSSSPPWLKSFGEWIGAFGWAVTLSIIVLVVGFIAWVIWRYRHVLRITGPVGLLNQKPPVARVVMGMQISPDTLPDDIPASAWMLWQQGRHHEAMGLLYRGSISRVMESARVEIQESDTEGDCVRRVEMAGEPASPDYFRGITSAWIRLAYAGINPSDGEVEVLCQQWPFGKGGTA